MDTKMSGRKTLIREGSGLDRLLSGQFGSTLFSYRQIFAMLLPLVMDSFFINIINMLTTAMISSSSQESVSAVSLVTPLYMMIYAVFNAISAGGTVVVAQFKGKGDMERVREAAGQLLVVTPAAALVACVLMIGFSRPLLVGLFGAADPVVLEKAETYLIGVAISMVFLAVYMGGFAVFRGLGDTKKCLHMTVIINLTHLLASLVFINLMHLDVVGSALSLNLARALGGLFSVWMLLSKKGVIRLAWQHVLRVDKQIMRQVFHIGIPFATEQVFLNGGGMLVQTYIVPLGTVSVAANAVGNTAVLLLYSAGNSVANLAVTVIGQCIGAGDKELAKWYGRKMILLGTGVLVLSLAVLLPLMPWILVLYQAPDNTVALIWQMVWITSVCLPFFWPVANIMPGVMRAAGDASFSSYFSLVTMWVIRVGLGYIFAIRLGLGVQGVWICMCLEWAVKTAVFWYRYRSGVWLQKQAVK